MNDNPYTLELRLCDNEGMVEGLYIDVLNGLRVLGDHDRYTGPPFPCTGSAHLAGHHIRCTSPAHYIVDGDLLDGWAATA